MAFDPTAFMDDFRTEAAEHIHALDAQLLALERDPSDPGPIRQMFLSAHTIKGGAAMLGLADVRELAHAMEDVLAGLRDGHRPLDPDTADALFAALDALRDLVGRASPGTVAPNDAVTSLVTALRERARPSPSAEVGASVDDRAAAPPELPRSPSSAPRVLLIEDSPTVRMLATMQLSDAGFQVDAVTDGAQALVRALEEEYELVVASVDMRGPSGLDLAAALRGSRSRSHLPIVLMSSDADPEERRRAADIGVNGYVRKGSFDEPWLAEVVQRIIGRGVA